MKFKILIPTIIIIIIILTGGLFYLKKIEAPKSIYKTNIDNKYIVKDYDESIEKLEESSVSFSASGLSFCSTQKSKEGIMLMSIEDGYKYTLEMSDIFVHPCIESVFPSNTDNSNNIALITSSPDFDPLCFSYPDYKYDSINNDLYLIYSDSYEHSLLLEDESMANEINSKSKATYTAMIMSKSDLDKFNHIYFIFNTPDNAN